MPGKVELYGTTGSVTLQPPDNGSNVTLTLPGSTGTVALTTGAGLQFITSQDFSAVSSVSVNNCFSATYQNYTVLINASGSTTAQDLRFRYRASGSDATGGNYKFQYFEVSTTTTTQSINNGDTSARVGTVISTANSLNILDIFDPFAVARTQLLTRNMQVGSTYNVWALEHTLSTSYDGFSVYPASGTISGNVRVYGYRNS